MAGAGAGVGAAEMTAPGWCADKGPSDCAANHSTRATAETTAAVERKRRCIAKARFVNYVALRKPRFDLAKRPIFGKTVRKFELSTPNHVASVAAY
jgi:hypothetical protein